jgi:diacylglycerol kinase family enzyme
VALLAGLAAVATIVAYVVLSPFASLGGAAAVAAATVCGWHAVAQRRHRLRWSAGAALGLAVTLVLLFDQLRDAALVGVILGLVAISLVAARVALHRQLVDRRVEAGTRVGRCHHPVLLINPRSGDGKAERVGLVSAARDRGIRPELLTPGADLAGLATDAVREGADALGMAGGDGSQALVAAVAARLDVPLVCVPSGTRNHFALDLGIDRNDVVGALAAFDEALEFRVDLGVITDASGAERVFVNNVVLGVYGRAVHSDEYRAAKVATLLETFAQYAGPAGFDYRFVGPDGSPHPPPDVVFLSNNPYQLASVSGFGTRARLDTGRLGVVSVRIDHPDQLATLAALELARRPHRFPGWTEWPTTELMVDSGEPIEAGVDGEAVQLTPPVRFSVLPGAVRVRIPAGRPQHRHRIPRPVRALAHLTRGRPPDDLPGPTTRADPSRS